MSDVVRTGEKCSRCGKDEWVVIDNKNEYMQVCNNIKCGNVKTIEKQSFVSNFECPDCGALSGELEENDLKLGVRCKNCGKLHIMLEKHTTINNRNKEIQSQNKPKCPTCSSTNIRKIGSGERVASIIGLGIFSKKINKTWKCNNCGHTW